jgi:hypothetical protein
MNVAKQQIPLLLPVLYFAFAHLSLLFAFVAIALDPRAVAGFFYHDRMVGIVHLVTLGWISASILGAIYVVAPLALRMPLAVRAGDYWAYGSTTIGITGMVSHFWIREFSGMAWSAIMVTAGFLYVGVRVVAGLRRAPIPLAVKAHIALAFLNVIGAVVVGVLLGFDKASPFLPGHPLARVFAHAHLAAIGWTAMMAVGIGYRLVPMVLPAAMPAGRSLYASAVLIEAGAVGLFVTLLLRSLWVPLFAAIAVAGLFAFLLHVVWMRRHPRRAPAALPRPDWGVRHVGLAFLYLVLAAAAGLVLAIAPMSGWTLRLALAYGVFGLVGFLAQLVIGMESRLLPLAAWSGPGSRSPHHMSLRAFDRWAWYAWAAGVPALAGGLAFDAVPFLSAGAWCLAVGTLLRTVSSIAVVRHTLPAAGNPACLVA